MPSLLRYFPAMALPPIVYGALAVVNGAGIAEGMKQTAFIVGMASGDQWHVSWGALFIGFSLLCFLAEILRTALPSTASLGVNLLLACALVPCLVLFLLVRGFGTDEFFLVCLMMMLDFLMDSAILVFTSRRTLEVT